MISVLLRQPKPFVVESEVFRFSEETGPFVGFVRRLRPFPSTLRLQLDLVSHDSSGTEAMLASTYMETGVAANIRTHLVHSHPRIHELPRGELRSILAHGANEDSHLAVLYSFGSCSNQATSARHTESAARWLARYFGCTRVISLTDFLSVPSSISPPNATNDTVQIYFRLHALQVLLFRGFCKRLTALTFCVVGPMAIPVKETFIKALAPMCHN